MKAWLEEISFTVGNLFHHLDLFKKLFEVIDKNDRLKSMDGTVISWMKKSFTFDLVIRIGRLCDDNKRTKSLVKLLRDLRKERNFLTRTHYIGLYKNSSITIKNKIANKIFDKLAGKGKRSYPVSLIDEDIKKLTKEDPCKKILDFRNDYVAHEARNKRPAPTYKDLFDACKVIEDIMIRYNSLLQARSVSDFTPAIQGNWEEVFTIPWIEGRKS